MNSESLPLNKYTQKSGGGGKFNPLGTVMLTGATGFLGSHILKELIKQKFKVVVLKRSFSNTNKIEFCLNNELVEVFDIDKVSIKNIFNNRKISSIIHCATNYGRGDTSCSEVLNSNLMFPISLLDECVKHNVKTFINTDSYFNKSNLEYPYLLNYSLSKKSLLLWLKYFSKDLEIVNMVLEHIFGEDDSEEKFVTKVINDIAIEKKKTINLTKGTQKRDFIYVDDVTAAYIAVLNNISGESGFYSFDVGLGVSISIREFVSTVKNISNSKTKLIFGALPPRENEIKDSVADNSGLINLGWQPKYSIKNAIIKTIKRTKKDV